MQSVSQIVGSALKIVGLDNGDYFRKGGSEILNSCLLELVKLNNWFALTKEIKLVFENNKASLPQDFTRVLDVFYNNKPLDVKTISSYKRDFKGLAIVGNSIIKSQDLADELDLIYLSNYFCYKIQENGDKTYYNNLSNFSDYDQIYLLLEEELVSLLFISRIYEEKGFIELSSSYANRFNDLLAIYKQDGSSANSIRM